MYSVESNGKKLLLDGTLSRYSGQYSNAVDGMDANKLFNAGECVSIKRGNYNLIVEERYSDFVTDTVFFRIWRMQKKMYQFEFIGKDFYVPWICASLEDKYLRTSIPVSVYDTTRINFTINNNPASYATDRFMLILKAAKRVIPIGYTYLNSELQNQTVELKWKSQNQDNIRKYSVQRSCGDGKFIDLTSIGLNPLSMNAYGWTDRTPLLGINYYRIGILYTDTTVEYSNITKATVNKSIQSISLFPNPATPGNLNLKMINQPSGTYSIMIINTAGNIIFRKRFFQLSGYNIINLTSDKIYPSGTYHLILFKPSNSAETLNVVF